MDVLIHQVLEQNTHQFFQDNTIDGNNRLRRVARPVVQRRVELGTGASRRWENYSIDLGELIERAPGAIYRVEIGFRPSYTDYPCVEGPPKDGGGWEYDPDVFSSYRSSHSLGYNYRERENPCHSSYYGSKRTIEKNVLVSDVGLVVKGSEQAWKAYVTHLTQGEVLPGAEVTLMNYQGQSVAFGTSNEKGAVDLKVDGGKPFMAVGIGTDRKRTSSSKMPRAFRFRPLMSRGSKSPKACSACCTRSVAFGDQETTSTSTPSLTTQTTPFLRIIQWCLP